MAKQLDKIKKEYWVMIRPKGSISPVKSVVFKTKKSQKSFLSEAKKQGLFKNIEYIFSR